MAYSGPNAEEIRKHILENIEVDKADVERLTEDLERAKESLAENQKQLECDHEWSDEKSSNGYLQIGEDVCGKCGYTWVY